MGWWQALGFPFVRPGGYLLGSEKEENKPPGSSSSASARLGDSTREKLTQKLLSCSVPLDVILQPAPFPQVTLLLAALTTAAASHTLWTVQGFSLPKD